MDGNGIAFIKQALFATRDWDTFQAILRRCIPRKNLDPAATRLKKG